MQSIELLNLLEKARARANLQSMIATQTQTELDAAQQRGMTILMKRLHSQLKRQKLAVENTYKEIREIEEQLQKEGDLLTTPKKK